MDSTPHFDGCQIIERLKSGPVADVYHAIQQPLGRPVLIKALSSSILPSSPFAAMLEREARLLSELHHPNILHLYDFVRKDERMWLVLEYVDGWTLEDLLARTKRLPHTAACAIALEVARALDHAHDRGVVHREVQPRNILVSRRGEIKLVGFSVAMNERSPTAPELLDGATPFGGPVYMSPEQILGEAPDPRSDLFSLGIVLYEMIAGVNPFAAPDERSVTQRIRHDPPAPLTRERADVPAAVERIIGRCLEKMPSDRFHSAAELVTALASATSEGVAGSQRQAIVGSLTRAGLLAEAPVSEADLSAQVIPQARRPSLGPAVRGLLACFGLIVVGGGAIQYLAAQNADGAAARPAGNSLPLVPSQPGYLRVVADPWAHVIVDGQKIDTTPFARSIPLSAGTHYVRLEHPSAVTERRTIRLVPGETVLLDVRMKVEGPKPLSSAEELDLAGPSDAASDAPYSP
ncbi:MAG TPA: serine/threonine-protein kinase [Polyangiaceae bacterium]|nr:serine/threonine-protein kinase [Polyangiaceae bacterium]